ncbi:hypothetical protein AB1Y20_014277 [Prymnesium parvum]|uniref:Protein-serine/threonine kinase n=1 Tax=Prymnesium parvum TaxID=97485 RepID=A0AB34IH76_PRYPA
MRPSAPLPAAASFSAAEALWYGLLELSAAEHAEGLVQCVGALVDNAVAACHAAGGDAPRRIHVSLQPDEEREGIYAVKVVDDGVGVDWEQLGEAVDFDRLDGTSSLRVGLKRLLLWGAHLAASPHLHVQSTHAASADVRTVRLHLAPSLAVHSASAATPKHRAAAYGGTAVSAALLGPPRVDEAAAAVRRRVEAVRGVWGEVGLVVSYRLGGEEGELEEAEEAEAPRGGRGGSAAERGGGEGGAGGGGGEEGDILHGVGEGVARPDASSLVVAALRLSARGGLVLIRPARTAATHASLLQAPLAASPPRPPPPALCPRPPPPASSSATSPVQLMSNNHQLIGAPGYRPHSRCALAAALAKANWSRVGLVFDPVALSLTKPSFSRSRVRSAALVVHLHGEQIRPGDLTRRWLPPADWLVEGLRAAIDAAMGEADLRLAAQGAPVSQIRQRAVAAAEAAGSIARSMGSILRGLSDASEKAACLSLLRVKDESECDAALEAGIRGCWKDAFELSGPRGEEAVEAEECEICPTIDVDPSDEWEESADGFW